MLFVCFWQVLSQFSNVFQMKPRRNIHKNNSINGLFDRNVTFARHQFKIFRLFCKFVSVCFFLNWYEHKTIGKRISHIVEVEKVFLLKQYLINNINQMWRRYKKVHGLSPRISALLWRENLLPHLFTENSIFFYSGRPVFYFLLVGSSLLGPLSITCVFSSFKRTNKAWNRIKWFSI